MSATSGRFVVRINPDLHRQLVEDGRRTNQSLNAVCVERLSRVTDLTSDYLAAWRVPYGTDLVGIVLFGSVARGEARADSDADVLFVLRSARAPVRSDYHAFDALPHAVRRFQGHEVSPHVVRLPFSPLEVGSLWLEVALDGVVLWEEERLVSETLRALRLLMANGDVRRNEAGGHSYWTWTR